MVRTAALPSTSRARLDLSYAAIGVVTQVAKYIIGLHYGRNPDHSLFMGYSNGGREAMIAAQRFPTECDGIVAGNPGFHLSAAAVATVFDVRQFMSIAPGGILSQALTDEDLTKVSSAILASCDAADGVEDGLVSAPSRCSFGSKDLAGLLTAEKATALGRVMDGAVDNEGHPIYSDWPFDPGIASPNCRIWKLGFSPAVESDALNVLIGGQSVPKLFLTPPSDGLPSELDFGAMAGNARETGALFDATSTYLSTFAARGGKMIIFHGNADPVFSANDIRHWYDRATTNTQDDFARMFMVPGMAHCGGGPAQDDFDPLTLLEDWIDSNTPPDLMPAEGAAFPGKEMPVCAYPQEAIYVGSDPNNLNSYACRMPTANAAT
jgi:feruloyl esterase